MVVPVRSLMNVRLTEARVNRRQVARKRGVTSAKYLMLIHRRAPREHEAANVERLARFLVCRVSELLKEWGCLTPVRRIRKSLESGSIKRA